MSIHNSDDGRPEKIYTPNENKMTEQELKDIELYLEWDDLSTDDAHKIISEIRRLQDKLNVIQSVVDEQANNIGLWIWPENAVEEYIQSELRRLHKVIEE
jgi:hypothetical protein